MAAQGNGLHSRRTCRHFHWISQAASVFVLVVNLQRHLGRYYKLSLSSFFTWLLVCVAAVFTTAPHSRKKFKNPRQQNFNGQSAQ